MLTFENVQIFWDIIHHKKLQESCPSLSTLVSSFEGYLSNLDMPYAKARFSTQVKTLLTNHLSTIQSFFSEMKREDLESIETSITAILKDMQNNSVDLKQVINETAEEEKSEKTNYARFIEKLNNNRSQFSLLQEAGQELPPFLATGDSTSSTSATRALNDAFQYYNKGYEYYDNKQDEKSLENFKKAKIILSAFGKSSFDLNLLIRTQTFLCHLYLNKHSWEDAFKVYKEACELVNRITDRDTGKELLENILELIKRVDCVDLTLSASPADENFSEAIEDCERIIKWLKLTSLLNLTDRDEVQYVIGLHQNKLSNYYLSKNEYEEAIISSKESILRIKQFGEKTPEDKTRLTECFCYLASALTKTHSREADKINACKEFLELANHFPEQDKNSYLIEAEKSCIRHVREMAMSKSKESKACLDHQQALIPLEFAISWMDVLQNKSNDDYLNLANWYFLSSLMWDKNENLSESARKCSLSLQAFLKMNLTNGIIDHNRVYDTLADVQNIIGSICTRLGIYKKAIEYFKHSIETMKKIERGFVSLTEKTKARRSQIDRVVSSQSKSSSSHNDQKQINNEMLSIINEIQQYHDEVKIKFFSEKTLLAVEEIPNNVAGLSYAVSPSFWSGQNSRDDEKSSDQDVIMSEPRRPVRRKK